MDKGPGASTMKKPIYAKLVLALVSIGFGMIANFVKPADRNGTALPERAKFVPGEYDVMNCTLDDGPVFGRDPRAARIEPVQKAADASEATPPPEMVDVTWEWVSLTTPVEQVNADAPERYTLQFQRDGRVALRADCNRGHGTYSVGADRQIALGPIALTRAACPPGSLGDRFAREVGRATSYFMRDGDLYLELPADSGTLRFRRPG